MIYKILRVVAVIGGFAFLITLGLSMYIDEQKFEDMLSNWPVVMIGFLIAVLLFRLRSISLLIYAVLEVGVGLTAMTYAVRWQNSGALTKLLALSSGIYIIVRGLDNLGKGLPDAVRSRIWEPILPSR